MPAILITIARVGLQVLAGVGLGAVLDKFVADKLPAAKGVFPQDINPGKPGFNPVRLLVLILTLGVAGIVLTFIGKKFKIKFLK